jgi:Protein of unknown function (DUF2846)
MRNRLGALTGECYDLNVSRQFLLAAVLVLVSFMAGCASIPMAALNEDAKAKSFAVQADKSNIYVYRNEVFGGAVLMTVTLDGKVAGHTGPQTYFLFELAPGSHEVGSIAEDATTLKLSTEAGKSYFVWQEVKVGLWMARSRLQQVNEETGRKGVAESKRVQASF